jgi:O-succinylbenzoate synthase
MNIAFLEVFRYRIPLVFPLNLAGGVHHFREGLVIRLTDKEGQYGLAEIAPLPGWHRETLDEILEQIIVSAPPVLKKVNRGKGTEPYQIFAGLNIPEFSSPSLQWGLELALLQLQTNKSGLNLYEILSDSVQDNIRVNALLAGKSDKVLQDAINRKEEGYGTLKIKVGRFPVEEEIQLINSLRETVGPEIKIRLDGNKSWSIAEAVHFGKSVNHLMIEFIEEPLRGLTHLSSFYDETGIPVGLDESLYLHQPEDLEPVLGIQFLILKPSSLGGYNKLNQWFQFAAQQDLKVVLSSTFESGISTAILVQLAGILQPGILAMGLDTLRWFESDLLKKGISVRAGGLNVLEVSKLSHDIVWDKLNLVDKIEL